MTASANCFLTKGRISRDKRAVMLEEDDFCECNNYFLQGWFQCLDKNGGGAEVLFPIRLQTHLSWSTKMLHCQNGVLVESQRMPLEKLSISGVASVDNWRGEYSYIRVHRP